MNKQILLRNIKRGEVYWGRLDDAEGYEQQSHRPLVIVSHERQNDLGNLLVVVPLSRSIEKIYPFHVPTFFNGEKGKAKCEQVRAITGARLEKRLGILDEKELEQIEEKLVVVLKLNNLIKRKVDQKLQEFIKNAKN
jgi:mRNA interferase MazF